MRDGEDAEAAVAAGGAAGSANGETGGGRGFGGGEARDVSEEDGGEEGEGYAEPDEGGVEGKVVGADGEAGCVFAEDSDHGCGDEEGGDDAGAAEDEAFSKERTAESGGGGAECGADGELGFAAEGAGEDEVGDVGAGDDEEQRGGGEEDPEDGVGAGVDLVVQAADGDLELVVALVDLGVGLEDGGVAGAELGAGLVEGGAGSEAAEELGHAMFAAGDHGGGEVVRAGDNVGDDFCGDGIGHRGFEDADDGGGAGPLEAVEAEGLAEDGGIGVQGLGPELIGEDDGALGIGSVVGGTEEAAEDGAQAHDFEVVAVDDAGGDGAWLA